MKPCQNLILELGVPDPAQGFFFLDRDALDSSKVLAPHPLPTTHPDQAPVPFTLDRSLLDGPDLIEAAGGGILPPGMVWLDFTSQSMSISVDRGIDVGQGVIGRPTSGTLTARVVDPYLDALSNQNVGILTPLRLRVDSEAVYSGYVTSLATTYSADGVPEVAVTSADGIAHLNSVLMGPRGQESFADRVVGVGQATGLNTDVHGGAAMQTRTGTDRSALDTLNVALDSEGGIAWINRDGTLVAYDLASLIAASQTVKYVFSDTHTRPGHVCFDAVQTTMDTRQVINTVTFRNIEHDTSDPDPARHRWVLNEHTFASSSSPDYYGVGQTTLTTALRPNQLAKYADDIFQLFDTPVRKVSSLEFPVDDFTTPVVPPVALLDLGDPVEVELTQADGIPAIHVSTVVAAISHRITPDRWTTQIGLF